MGTQVRMPQLGESVVEGTVSRWLKREGEVVTEYEALLEISTDKVDSEIPAPAEGVVLRILVAAGETVATGTVLAEIGTPGEKTASAPARRGRVSPAVARLVAEHGVDLDAITGTGREGRITRRDVEAWIAHQVPAVSEAPGELVPLTAMRRAIAEHMVASAQTAPQVTVVHEADMSAVLAQQEALQAAQPGQRMTLSAWFVAIVARALALHPWLNAEWRREGIFLHQKCHIGLAVALDEGLIVPVIRDAGRRGLADIARAVQDLSLRARERCLTAEEVRGATFTISNFGTGGSLVGTPIISQPQVAILGVGAMQQRAVVVAGEIVARPMCYLSLSFDHRVVDGAVADNFMRCVKEKLESVADEDLESDNR